MSLAWERAKNKFEELKVYPKNIQVTEKNKLEIVDGDFVINQEFEVGKGNLWGVGMYDKHLLIGAKEYERINEFARKKGLNVVKPYLLNGYSYELRSKSKDIKEEIKDKLKFLRHFFHPPQHPKTLLYANNSFFISKDPHLFEEFGREVYGLRTEAEKSQKS